MEQPQQQFGRVNLKLSGQTPGSIPMELLPHILALTGEQQVAFIEGHMRAGCVHLVFDIMSAASALQWDVMAVATRLMAFDTFWRHGRYFAQLPNGAIEWHNGRVTSLWAGSNLHSHTPSLQLGQSLSAIACVVSGQACRLHVTAQPPPATSHSQPRPKPTAGARVLARYGGKFVVDSDLLSCSTCARQLSAAHMAALADTPQGAILVPGLEGVGVLHLEAEHDGFLSAPQPVVVAPDQEVQQDVCKLIEIVQAAG